MLILEVSGPTTVEPAAVLSPRRALALPFSGLPSSRVLLLDCRGAGAVPRRDPFPALALNSRWGC